MKRNLYVGLSFVAVVGALGIGSLLLEKKSVVHAAATLAPRFEVDPLWPKPLPNHWLMGNALRVAADAKDNIWINRRVCSLEPNELHLNSEQLQCCAAADPVLVLNRIQQSSNHWGGPGQ